MNRLLILALAIVCLCTLPANAQEEFETLGPLDLFQTGAIDAPYTVNSGIALFGGLQNDGLYQFIYEGLSKGQTMINLSSFELPGDDPYYGNLVLKETFESVVNDHPEFFNICNYSYSKNANNTIGYVLPVEFSLDVDTETAKKNYAAKLQEAVEFAEQGETDLERAMLAHDYLVYHVAYNWDVATGKIQNLNDPSVPKHIFSAYGALVLGDAVCQGYTMAYKAILHQLGINNINCPSATMNHIWNVIELDEEWYHVDVTWDDPTMDLKGYCRYNNFLCSDAEITAQGHSDWTLSASDLPMGSAFDSGYIFNDSDSSLYHAADGYYYYVDAMTLFRADSLNGTPERVCALETGESSGAHYVPEADSFVWVENTLYYGVQWNSKTPDGVVDLMACNLLNGSCMQVAEYPFTENKKELITRPDRSGVWYDEGNRAIHVICSNCPGEVYGVYEIPVPPEYPEKWDEADAETTAILGTERTLMDLQIGVMLAEGKVGTLCAAFYIDGRMKAIHTFELTQQGLNVLELARESIPADAVMKLFLIDAETVAPLCAAYPNN